jgi:hypothetical protein
VSIHRGLILRQAQDDGAFFAEIESKTIQSVAKRPEWFA